MRRLAVGFACILLASCNGGTDTSGALQGSWTLDAASAHTPIDPRTLVLTQHGTTISGTGNAMGIDGPMPLSVSGTIVDAVIALDFTFTNGGGGGGHYTGTLVDANHVIGQVVFDVTFQGLTDSLAFTRK